MERSIDELPDELRIVFVACVVDGMTPGQFAELFAPTSETVEARLHNELLGERWYRSEGVPRLSFARHVDHLDAGKDRRGAGHRQPLVALNAWEWKR